MCFLLLRRGSYTVPPWFVYRASVVRIPCLRGSYTVPYLGGFGRYFRPFLARCRAWDGVGWVLKFTR